MLGCFKVFVSCDILVSLTMNHVHKNIHLRLYSESKTVTLVFSEIALESAELSSSTFAPDIQCVRSPRDRQPLAYKPTYFYFSSVGIGRFWPNFEPSTVY